jgi:hypothetical protein
VVDLNLRITSIHESSLTAEIFEISSAAGSASRLNCGLQRERGTATVRASISRPAECAVIRPMNSATAASRADGQHEWLGLLGAGDFFFTIAC